VVEGDEPPRFFDFMEHIEQHARRTGAVELTIGSFGTPGHDGELGKLGYALHHRLEFCLTLDRPAEEIWGAMERRRRRTIQKAEELGVTVNFLPAQEGIAHLRRLQAITAERLSRRGAVVQMGTSRGPEKDPVAVLINSGMGDLIGAWHEGKVVSVSLYTKMNGLAYSTLAGHAPEAYQTQAYSLLLWKTIQNYQAAGLRWLNVGGVPASAADPTSADHGLYGFKIGLGCAVHTCVTASKLLRPGRAKLLASVKSILGR
jgi:lipid II:glycine glycyltransferase (peptidoglycan interpeptide bridge formation enzyme)